MNRRSHRSAAGLSEGPGSSALADGGGSGAGLRGQRAAAALAGGRPAQVVEVPVGDVGEALEAALVEQVAGPEAEPAGGGTGEGAVQGVDFGEQPDVGPGVPAGEGARGGATLTSHWKRLRVDILQTSAVR